jgi:hypothetical protein
MVGTSRRRACTQKLHSAAIMQGLQAAAQLHCSPAQHMLSTLQAHSLQPLPACMHTVLVLLSSRYERSQREDGRRCHKWFLVDHLGSEHLAVVGIETDTMDGHYSYQAVSDLTMSAAAPVQAAVRAASLQQRAPARMHCSLLRITC